MALEITTIKSVCFRLFKARERARNYVFGVSVDMELPVTVHSVRIFTDNATAQFKNQFIISAIHSLERLFGKKIQWNFSAAQHGKCVCDGLGATIKNYVFRRVKSGTNEFTNAMQLKLLVDLRLY